MARCVRRPSLRRGARIETIPPRRPPSDQKVAPRSGEGLTSSKTSVQLIAVPHHFMDLVRGFQAKAGGEPPHSTTLRDTSRHRAMPEPNPRRAQRPKEGPATSPRTPQVLPVGHCQRVCWFSGTRPRPPPPVAAGKNAGWSWGIPSACRSATGRCAPGRRAVRLAAVLRTGLGTAMGSTPAAVPGPRARRKPDSGV